MVHCDEHVDRLAHIINVRALLNQPIEIVKGYYTRDIPLCDQASYMKSHDPNLNINDLPFYMSGAIGCYLSHHMLVKNITVEGHSVIFEDDVIFNSDLHECIVQIIKDSPAFDVIFLGNIKDSHGTRIINNIYNYNPTTDCWGTHALLIKNSPKIYETSCTNICDLDHHYVKLMNSGELTGHFIYPSICFQDNSLYSNINYRKNGTL